MYVFKYVRVYELISIHAYLGHMGMDASRNCVCICECICVYLCIHVCMYEYVCMHVCTLIFFVTWAWMHPETVYICICICVYLCMHICMYVRVYAYRLGHMGMDKT